ncbi:Trimethyllysine dioxygenase [Holothuria leucospilota]|uniref:Trimethyllysine dioxygenase n=1 Tax=Holothuria leucospilota TaxID=206669 RepID=A0A9Q1CJ25_HOLLE|nr:Trimethyllysine dioxygenase [Holothuria leucospilota]
MQEKRARIACGVRSEREMGAADLMSLSSQVISSVRALLRPSSCVCRQLSSVSRKFQGLPLPYNTKSIKVHHQLHIQAKETASSPSKYERLLQASLGVHVRSKRVVQKLRCCNGMMEVTWKDNSSSRYHSKWLWYNCACNRCVQTNSGQKLLQPREIPQRLTLVDVIEYENSEGAFVEVRFQETDHRVRLPQEWLWLYSYSTESLREKSDMRDTPNFTEGPIKAFDFQKVKDTESDHYFEWLHNLNLDGVTLVTNVPTEREAMAEVGELIGPVTTNLYGKVSDVEASEKPINIAYSQVGLQLHQDLMYYESPPGLQLLHCLRFCPQVVGGESIFIDAFHIGERLREIYPQHFQTLLEVPATFKKIHFERNNPAAYFYQRPHITVNRQNKELVEPYFEAYQAFAEILDKAPLITHRMVPGDCLVFNNRRMLHGRNEFKLNGGKRHLQVCYVNIDDYIQRVQVNHLKRQTGQYARRVGNQCFL